MRSVAALLLFTAFSLFALDNPVRTANGSLSGIPGRNPSVLVFKGIPYAAPPIGDLRWKAPVPAAPWHGVRKADSYSATCMQTAYPAISIYHSEPEPVNEDCLYLNVWTAAKSAKDRRPVMVWIHGGALTRGSGSVSLYDGEALAKKGVVLVTINYRLGVFGFLAHPELTKESDHNSSGNYGLLDQVAALAWVRKNIGAFGGDPQRVTIFGESAGSWSVNYLMATPLAKGLFERAIGESGAAFDTVKKLADAEESGARFGKSIGADTIAALRAKPADELMKSAGFSSFPPNVDGWMLPHDVYTIFATGKQNDVPILIGSNADEAKSLTMWPAEGTIKTFLGQVKARFGPETDSVLKVYPASTDVQAKASFFQSFTDYVFTWEMRTWARLETQTGKNKAYLYFFNRVPPGPVSEKLGAFHASEIPYAFDNVGMSKWNKYDDTDQKLADTMSSYWVNFAATGDPNGEGLPDWPSYQERTNVGLELGDHVRPINGIHKDQLDFLDRYFAGQREKQAKASLPTASR